MISENGTVKITMSDPFNAGPEYIEVRSAIRAASVAGTSWTVVNEKGDPVAVISPVWKQSGDVRFAVVTGLPQTFGNLDEAEQWAGSRTEADQQDRTIFPVPGNALDNALVTEYTGVRLITLREARERDDERSGNEQEDDE